MIPADNVPHLMLSDEVISAVEAGRFHVYSVRRLDETMELLSGIASGARDAQGNYPEGTLNAGVDKHLSDFARGRQQFARKALRAGSPP